MKKISLAFSLCCFLAACESENSQNATSQTPQEVAYTPTISYTITNRLLHDKNAFIEGLLMKDGKLFESTGSPNEMPNTTSMIGVLDTKIGKLQQKIKIDNALFGEGIVFLNNKLYQLTYQAKKGFVYDATTYKKLAEFVIPTAEGWGLTTDGTNLIMSDGSSKLTYLNADNFSVIKTISVNNEYGSVQYLNELEYVKGIIYANIYTTNSIVKIDASNGKVVGKIDGSALANEVKSQYAGSMEMNGIAYNADKDVFLLTGKMWPTVFEVKLN
jgi:glutaminyl-peptide cyclotransferase